MDNCTVAWEVWGLPMCVEWGVIFPVGCHKERQREKSSRGGVDLTRSDGKAQPQHNSFWMIYILRAAPLHRANDLFFCLLFSPHRTLNNNNISGISVSSFNHMPKLRTLWVTPQSLSLSGGRQLFKMKLYSTCMHTQKGKSNTISMGINVIPDSFGKQP